MLLVFLLLLLFPGLNSLPPEATSSPPNFTVSAGQQISLNCSNNQSDAVFWTDNSGAILPSQHFETVYQLTASYVIESADRSLNGSTFHCVANQTNSQSITDVTIQVLFIDTPTVSVRQSDVRVGETIFLNCETDAWPTVSFDWSHSGTLLGSTSQLIVPVTSPTVAGQYSCTATNSEDTVTSSVDVSVTAGDSDFLLYRNESSAVEMVCNGTDLVWFLFDTILTPSTLPAGVYIEVYVTPYSSTLLITVLDTSLAANYSCSLNSSNTLNSNFQIIIPNIEDSFQLSPNSREVFPKESLYLPCSPPDGTPEPAISWYRSDLSVPISNTSISGVSLLANGFLSFSSFSQSDVGTYSCVAHNFAGFRFVSADLSLMAAPNATILLVNTPAVSPLVFDDVITLTCNISTGGPVVYRWLESGQLIGQNEQLTVYESGEYRCEVEIATSQSSVVIQSDLLILTRNNTLSFAGEISNQIVEEGDTVSVTCDTLGGTNVEYLWFYGNEEITNSTNRIVWNNQLTLIQVSQESAGEYQCYVISQSDSKAIRQSFQLLVRFGPVVRTPYSSVTLIEGSRGEIECHVDGSPVPLVKWMRLGNQILNSTFQNGTLIISVVDLSSAGRYLCIATDPTNQNNSMSAPVDVIVLPSAPLIPSLSSPSLVQVLVPVGVVLGVIILLACCVVCVAFLARRSCSRNRSLYLRDLEAQDSPNRPRGKSSPKYHPLVAQQTNLTDSAKQEIKFPLIGFPRDELNFGTRLGDGAYGPIIEGTIEEFLGQRRHVAVECYISKSDEGSFPKPDELHTWPVFFLFHDNLSRVLGICTSVEPYYVIYEYSDRGCLKEYLRNYKDQIGTNTTGHSPAASQLLTQALLLRMCRQAALGLEFLAQNDMVFRDVAARNCCVSSSLDIKLINLPIGPNLFPGDYYRRDKEFVPVRWMSPESLQNSQFTTKSDVWAFGIFCWEVFTYARQPYETQSDEFVLEKVPQGLRLAEPEEGCPEGAFKLMIQCWNQNPDKRPSFSTLCVNLNDVSCD